MNQNFDKRRKAARPGKLIRFALLFLLAVCAPCRMMGSVPAMLKSSQPSQGRTVRGTVKDSENNPLIGVSVLVKGTKTGVVTDVDGNYIITVPSADNVLVFSYVGFVPQEIKAGNRSSVNVVLREDRALLNEVVVIGYGIQKKKLVTGATVQVKGEDLQKLSTHSVLGALQSQAPGVSIVQSSGMPGEGFKVRIRGLGTIGNSDPLYVIDGIPGGNINNLNPADIESVDILKDAASAAIYGSRGANGIILVTTRQGRKGKSQIAYDGYVGWQNVYKMAPLLNATEYMQIINEALRNDGAPTIDFAAQIPYQYNAIINGTWNGTNWLNQIRNQNAIDQNHSLSFTGGSAQSSYSIGLSHAQQEGILGEPVAPDFKRFNVRVNSQHTLVKNDRFDVIRVGENITYSHRENAGIAIGNRYWNDIGSMLSATPLMPVYNGAGEYFDQPSKDRDEWTFWSGAVNPIAAMEYMRGHNISKNFALRMNAFVEIQPVKDLKFKSLFGYNNSAGSYRQYTPSYNLSPSVVDENDHVNQSQNSGWGWNIENTLTYDVTAGKDHHLEALLGHSISRWGYGDNLAAKNANSLFPGSWKHAWINNTQGISETNTSVSGSPWGDGASVSFFGRVNYNYKEKYLASASLRADGSSNFARGNRWGHFPAASAGWVISNEPFMKPVLNWMDFFKVRASWGQNGNSDIPNFQYRATIAFNPYQGGYYFGNKTTLQVGGYPDIVANPSVSWEKSEQLNLGFDARFISSKLGLNFDWYKKNTKDWLVQAPILATYGTNPPYINGGEIENTGAEAVVSWNDRVSDFRYGLSFNMAYNHNEVVRIANSEGIIHGDAGVLSQNTTEMYRAEVGFPVGYFWGYKTAGVFQNLEQLANTPVKLAGAQPGDLIFVDTDGSGVIDDKDKVLIGNPHPDVIIGFNLNFAYKGFDFSATARGAFGHQIARSYRSFVDAPYQNYTTDIFGRWHGEGTSNRLPRLTNGGHTNWAKISDIYVEDADYVKVQNVTLGYDFKRLFRNMPVSQARLYAAVNNLYTFTGYSGMDPEIGYGDGRAWASGIDVGFYPSPRTFLLGVSIKY
ncbi:SusC/RagA family TonB-linked outer membrane protein [Desertivirga xinjiangensis]|uniref:SusC/RagA family TonB-linked outer membrane protein n=1 Tax=Desertivirga xinjiangensis TaxID=539206 RepID=UPI0021093B40|nr:TonB-dependent receptor [Pedobacter xinjiangensis]